eukprot:7251728-Pyramimonas_sp.AAC.1
MGSGHRLMLQGCWNAGGDGPWGGTIQAIACVRAAAVLAHSVRIAEHSAFAMPPSRGNVSVDERKAGADLLHMFLRLYASCRITAQHLRLLCELCSKAKVQGGCFDAYARPEGLQSGKYQLHLDRVLPVVDHLYSVQAPMN